MKSFRISFSIKIYHPRNIWLRRFLNYRLPYSRERVVQRCSKFQATFTLSASISGPRLREPARRLLPRDPFAGRRGIRRAGPRQGARPRRTPAQPRPDCRAARSLIISAPFFTIVFHISFFSGGRVRKGKF